MIPTCAAWSSTDTACQENGKYACKSCLLVAYCGPACQKAHWPQHKIHCKSPPGKKSWQPAWALQDRTPAFMGGGIVEEFGGKKYLWGNMPAYDVLKLDNNEGLSYKGPLSLLFAASGDLRNLLTTISKLPKSYTGTLEATLNDRDLDVVGRNLIMLLIALTLEDHEEATDCIVHIWYSSLIRKSHLEIMQSRIRVLVQDVCDKISSKDPKSLQAKTWRFGKKHSLRLVLPQPTWKQLLAYMDVPPGLDAQKANKIRQVVTLAESRVDYRDRHLMFFSPSHRIAKTRYWEDGLLLPFGARRDEFNVPNPSVIIPRPMQDVANWLTPCYRTLFATADSWPLRDNADPSSGWRLEDVEATPSGPATADLYGKVYGHVYSIVRSFLERLDGLEATSFTLLNDDALKLDDNLGGSHFFDRIEVSNISDCGYAGPHYTVGLLSPMLRDAVTNPHATLITLFMNVVQENRTPQEEVNDMVGNRQTTEALLRYLRASSPTARNSKHDPAVMKFHCARDFVATHDRYFDRFANKFKLAELAQVCGLAIKDRHTIIEKWPYNLKLRPGQAGAQEEFDRALQGSPSSKERYMEWKRVPAVHRSF